MMLRMRPVLLLFFCLLASSCTTSRWTVVEESALDEAEEAEILSQKTELLLTRRATVENPYLTFSLHEITEREFVQRVQVERSVQKYRPQWGFFTLGLTGTLFALLAANTDMVFPSSSVSRQVALNLAGGFVGAFSLMNLEPDGAPIYTGETKMMRRSGIEVVSDTTRQTEADAGFTADLAVRYRGEEIYRQEDLELAGGELEVNLASFSEEIDLNTPFDEGTEVFVQLEYNGTTLEVPLSVSDFLSPFLNITEPVAILRSSPDLNPENIINEVGEGSFFEITGESSGNWYEVRYGGSELYVNKTAGEVSWISPESSESNQVVEFQEMDFGEIDVENAIPIIRQRNQYDRALVLTNGIENHIGTRQYLPRDHRLFEFYMRSALQMNAGQIHSLEGTTSDSWLGDLNSILSMEGRGALVVYLSGYAAINDAGEMELVYENEDGAVFVTGFNEIMNQLKRIRPDELYVFADLEFYQESDGQNGEIPVFANQLVLQESVNDLFRDLPDAVVIFSNRPGQQSSVYTGDEGENQRHHIFNYYWAEALKQRKTRMAELIRYLENNVDYTSRRLHDLPQEIQAYGNFSLNLAE